MVDAQLPTSPLSTSAYVLLHVQKCFHGRDWESFPEVKILYCLFHLNQSLIEWNYFLYSKLQSHVLQTYQNIYMFLGRMTEQMEFLHKPVFFSQKRRQKKEILTWKVVHVSLKTQPNKNKSCNSYSRHNLPHWNNVTKHWILPPPQHHIPITFCPAQLILLWEFCERNCYYL